MAEKHVVLPIGADLTEFKAAMGQAVNELRKIAAATNKATSGAGGDAGFGSIKKSIDGAQASLSLFIRSVIGIATLGASIKIADDFANLQARLKLVTDGTNEFVLAQERLFDIAQKTGQSFSNVADLYSKIARAVEGSGTSQEALLQVIETINKAVQLSGVSAESANAALIQLGQGLASGTLRGDELRSVMEQIPVVADAIAKGMGITRGELRKYGEQGKISGDAVLNALIKQREEIDNQAAQLPITFGRAAQRLKNSVTLLIGEFDQAAQGTGGLAGAVKDLADFMASDGVRNAMVETAVVWGNSIRDIGHDFADAVRIINADSGGLMDFLGRAFKELPVNIRASVQAITVTIAGMVDGFVADARLMKEAFLAVFTDDTIDAAIQRRNESVKRSLQTVKESIDDIMAARDRQLKAGKDAAEAAQKARDKARATGGDVRVGRQKGSSVSEFSVPEMRKQADETFRLVKDQLNRESRALDQALADRTVSITAWYAEKSRIAEAGFAYERTRLERERQENLDHLAKLEAAAAAATKQSDRAKADKEILKTKADIAKIDADLLIAERERQQAADDLARAQEKATKDYQKSLEEMRIALKRASGQELEASLAEIDRAWEEAKKKFAGDAEALDIAGKLFNAEKFKARFEGLKRKADEVMKGVQSGQESVANQVATGAISPATASQQVRADREEAIRQLTVLADKMRELGELSGDPAIKTGAEEANASLKKLGVEGATGMDAAVIQLRASLANMEQDFAKAATGSAVEGLSTFFLDLADSSKTAGDALRDFVRGFAQSMAQIAARALATFLVLQSLDVIYPGLGRTTAAMMGANVNHRGGMAGTGPVRMVDPMLFAAAPRYHSGGMVGLKPDEVPAILQKGEEVLAKNDPRNAANGGGSGTRIINVIDPSLVSDYLTSSSGEKAILNILQRNPGAVRQVIA